MNNIYDVVLNFNKYYYEVYEWKSSDEIENIRKIPFFKVSDKVFVIIRDNDVKISKDVLSKLRSYYTFLDDEILEIKCLITNCKSCMGIIIDKEGYITKRSSMLYDEEEEVLEEARDAKIVEFKFDYIKKYDIDNCRILNEKKQVLYSFINNISDKMILKYIYYDYYLKECDDVDKIKKDFIDEISDCEYSKLFRLYDVVKVFYNYIK